MRVTIVSPVFPPEPIVSAQTSAQVAEGLAARGAEVTVVTAFPNRPAGRLYPGFSRRLFAREATASGLRLIRCGSLISTESSLLNRLGENASFGVLSSLAVLAGRRPDVIYANSWPIVATGLLFLAARARRIPLVISVQDVYPEALIAQGRIRAGGMAARLMRSIDGFIARRASHVIVISRGFAEVYGRQRRVDPARLSLIPNWIDADRVDASVPRDQYRRRRGFSDSDFLLVYGGNVGAAAGVEDVVRAMALLRDVPHLQLVIAGSGARLDACRNLARDHGEARVHIHSPWETGETSEVLRAADLLLLPTQRDQSLVSVPSKLLAYMLAGRPILATALPGSDLADMIERAACGWSIAPDRPEALAAEIRRVTALEPGERDRRGQSGRAYALQHLATEACLPQVLRLIERAGL